MGDVVKSFLKCRQSMHKSFRGDYERKGKTCSAVRLFVKKRKADLRFNCYAYLKT